MFATIAFILSLTTPAEVATVDPCPIILADAPNLDGLAVTMAEECTQAAAQSRLASGRVEYTGMRLARPVWAFAPMRHQPELDAETVAAIGDAANPFALENSR